MLVTRTVNGQSLSYLDYGPPSGCSVVVIFSGWCQDHRGWKTLLPYLLSDFRVICLNWRGHGPIRDPVPDFGVQEQVADYVALLDALDIPTFIALSHSHGGWAAMQVAQTLGTQRVPAVLLLDLIMTEAPPPFIESLKAIQDESRWRPALASLMQGWGASTSNARFREARWKYSGRFGFDMWSRGCHEVERAYETWGSPMKRMEAIKEPPLIRHLFSHPKYPAYVELHEDFQLKHPHWFSFVRLPGDTHFPGIELPESVALALKELEVESGI
ncbi:hypothetical protein FE257_004941 [Aspergillus nanangensis]|uniref:AB hydrolase-1 domain-containing protein n=1 Tax=Aspergillus nanangensis TaxID=2582783 RepID=A0AAD4CAH4_ASPNN|nr:hypothetical protein FE257_004941 [Aspergillus nanangensis]